MMLPSISTAADSMSEPGQVLQQNRHDVLIHFRLRVFNFTTRSYRRMDDTDFRFLSKLKLCLRREEQPKLAAFTTSRILIFYYIYFKI